MTIRMTKKNSEIAKGAGTAAREAVKDAKALEEKKQKELQEKEAQVIKQGEHKSHKAFKQIQRNKIVGNRTDLVVLPAGNGIHLYPEDELKDMVWNSANNVLYGISYKNLNVRNLHFGWVSFEDKIIPSYDLSVIEKDGKYSVVPNSM